MRNHDLAALGERVRKAEREYKANDFSARVKLGMAWLAAREEFDLTGTGTWNQWVEAHGDGRSERDVRALIALAKTADPEATAAEERSAAAARMAALREKRSMQTGTEAAGPNQAQPVWNTAPAIATGPDLTAAEPAPPDPDELMRLIVSVVQTLQSSGDRLGEIPRQQRRTMAELLDRLAYQLRTIDALAESDAARGRLMAV